MNRLVITGVPGAGKTTYANSGPQPIYHSDDLIDHMGWSEMSEHIARHVYTLPDPWVSEGVADVRALRKFLVLFPDDAPCDEVIWIPKSRIQLTPHAAAMAKSCHTIWDEIRASLVARGVSVSTVYPDGTTIMEGSPDA